MTVKMKWNYTYKIKDYFYTSQTEQQTLFLCLQYETRSGLFVDRFQNNGDLVLRLLQKICLNIGRSACYPLLPLFIDPFCFICYKTERICCFWGYILTPPTSSAMFSRGLMYCYSAQFEMICHWIRKPVNAIVIHFWTEVDVWWALFPVLIEVWLLVANYSCCTL